MCRNIKPLFNFEPPVTDDEVRAASLQFVRKISGFTKPSQANEAAFEAAIEEITRGFVAADARADDWRAAEEPRGRSGEGQELAALHVSGD